MAEHQILLTEMERRRLANARRLAQGFPSNKHFADALGITKSGISQLIGHSPARSISERTARRWERKLGLPEGSLDQIAQQPAPGPDARSPRATPVRPESPEIVLLEAVMREVDASLQKLGVSLLPEKHRALVAHLYRQGLTHGHRADVGAVDDLVRLAR
jgi:transcriptional regulator with XRE-family HTH domain